MTTTLSGLWAIGSKDLVVALSQRYAARHTSTIAVRYEEVVFDVTGFSKGSVFDAMVKGVGTTMLPVLPRDHEVSRLYLQRFVDEPRGWVVYAESRVERRR